MYFMVRMAKTKPLLLFVTQIANCGCFFVVVCLFGIVIMRNYTVKVFAVYEDMTI